MLDNQAVQASVKLNEFLKLVGKSKNVLAPIYEAIMNSFESIAVNENIDDSKKNITINIFFKGLSEEEIRFDCIEIVDSGVGLDSVNYDRFSTLLDNNKGFNNRGSGRIQFIHFYDQIEVKSNYFDGSCFRNRSFKFNKDRFIYDYEDLMDEKVNLSGFSITMKSFSGSEKEKYFMDCLSVEYLKKAILKHFILRLFLDSEKEGYSIPNIYINSFFNGSELKKVSISGDDIIKPDDSGDIELSYVKIKDKKAEKIEWIPQKDRKEVLSWAHFKLPKEDADRNSIFLCSKDVPVEAVDVKEIKRDEAHKGNFYLTAVYGALLDRPENVSHSVDAFTFQKKADIERLASDDLYFDENAEYLFDEIIKKGVKDEIPNIYKEVLEEKQGKENLLSKIALENGISDEISSKVNVSISDTEETITKKLFRKQGEVLAERSIKINKIFKELNSLNPTNTSYQEELKIKSNELLDLIPQQNKDELGRYVIRREMVADILNKILNNDLQYQNDSSIKRKDKEGLVHDLIFKRKSTDTDVLNDLWILDEQFLHFEGCSELRLNQIEYSNGKKLMGKIPEDILEHFGDVFDRRPDIFLYVEEGKCVVIELKEPEAHLLRDLEQTVKYINLIANFATVRIDKFYCYLVGENIPEFDIPGDYIETVNGDYVKADMPIKSLKKENKGQVIASAHMEVTKLSSLYERAHRRNKSFADKLGIRINEQIQD